MGPHRNAKLARLCTRRGVIHPPLEKPIDLLSSRLLGLVRPMEWEMDREKDERSEMTCQMNMKGSPRARRHQPIGESQANSSSRLGEVEAEVVCCSPVPAGHSSTQPPGSCRPPTRAATHGKQVAPISRLVRHAGGYSVPILNPASQGGPFSRLLRHAGSQWAYS